MNLRNVAVAESFVNNFTVGICAVKCHSKNVEICFTAALLRAIQLTLHVGRVANTLACNVRGQVSPPQFRQHFRDNFSK